MLGGQREAFCHEGCGAEARPMPRSDFACSSVMLCNVKRIRDLDDWR